MVNELKHIKKPIKPALKDNETELSEWAKKRIREARKTPDSEYVSQEEVEHKMLE